MYVRLVWAVILILISILLPMGALSQSPPLTSITDTLRLGDGTLASGSVYITLQATCTIAGVRIQQGPVTTVSVNYGAFSVSLVPNGSCLPSSAYLFEYNLVNEEGLPAQRSSEICTVPATSVTSLSSICQSTSNVPVSPTIPIGSLTGGMARGDLIAFDGLAWARLAACGNGQVRIYDSSQPLGFSCSPTFYSLTSAQFDFSNVWIIPWRGGNGLPPFAECVADAHKGRAWFRKDTASSQASLYVCANDAIGHIGWELAGGGGGGGGGGTGDAYTTITNGVQSISATGSSSLLLASSDAGVIRVELTSNDPVYGDIARFVLAEGSLTPTHLSLVNAAAGGGYIRISPDDLSMFQVRASNEVLQDIGAASSLHSSQHVWGGTDRVGWDSPGPNRIPTTNSQGWLDWNWMRTSDPGPNGGGSWAGLTKNANYYTSFRVQVNGGSPFEETHPSALAEAVVGEINVPASADYGGHAAGIAGRCRTASGQLGCVGVYGSGFANPSGTPSTINVWGANFMANNMGQNIAGVFAEELNVNIDGATPEQAANYVIGSVVTGASTQPARIGSTGYLVWPMSGNGATPNIRWNNAFESVTASAQVGLKLWPDSYTLGSPSQSIQFLASSPGGGVWLSALRGVGASLEASAVGGMDLVASGGATVVARLKASHAEGYSGIHFLSNTGALMGHIGYGNASTANTTVREKMYFGSIGSIDVLLTTSDLIRGVWSTGGKFGWGNSSPVTSGTGLVHFSGNTSRILDALRTPATPSETGYSGEFALDASYLWLNISGTWRKIPHISHGDVSIGIVSAPTDHYMVVGNGTSWGGVSIPDCPTNSLGYDRATRTIVCNVMSGGGTGIPAREHLFTTSSGTTISFNNSTHGCGHGHIFTELQREVSTDVYEPFQAPVSKGRASPWAITYTLTTAMNGRVIYACWGGSGSTLGNVGGADGSPSLSNISSLLADEADGFVISQPGSGQAQLDLAAVPNSVLAGVTDGTLLTRAGFYEQTSLAAAVTTTNLISSAPAGTYQILGYIQATTPASGACTSTLTLGWTYNSSAKTSQPLIVDDATDENYGQFPGFVLRAAAATDITIAISRDPGSGGSCSGLVQDVYLYALKIK